MGIKKKSINPLPRLKAKAQEVFNKWIRKRDEGQPCISCGKPANQAGHYFPVKMFSALQFDETNVNAQCPHCNLFAHGNQAMYRIGLVRKYGEDAVRELEERAISDRLKKWTRTELEEIINKYK